MHVCQTADYSYATTYDRQSTRFYLFADYHYQHRRCFGETVLYANMTSYGKKTWLKMPMLCIGNAVFKAYHRQLNNRVKAEVIISLQI